MPGSTGRRRSTTCSWPTRRARRWWPRRSRTTRQGCRRCAARSCGSRSRWSRSSGRTGCWSSGCWTRGCGCWRCIPNKVAAARDRFRVSGGKSDRFDAFVLCELARTDHHRFRVLEPDCDQTKAIRALTRAREDLVGSTGRGRQPAPRRARAVLARAAAAVQPHGQPDPARVPGALPQPRGRARSRASSACRRSWAASATPAGSSPPQLMAKLRRAPEGRVGELELAPAAQLVLALVAMIEPLERADQASSSARSRPRVRAHPDGADLPLAVQIARQRDLRRGAARRDRRLPRALPHRDALAADAGQAAVAIESGKRKAACFRWACNKRLRDAFCTLADTSRHWHPWAADLYARARPRPRPPARDPHPRTRLVPRRLALLARPHPVRPRPTPRPATTHHRHHPSSSGPVPDLAATQRMAGAAVTQRAARRAEREALDGKPTSATSARGLMS